MGKLGTWFGLIAAVLAIAAAALSFLISGKRALYEERASKLADSVAKMVQNMDQNSNSGVAASVSFTPADKTAKTPEDGTLSWKKFEASPDSFTGSLNQAVTLSQSLNQQRDGLADALGKTATTYLRMPDADLDPAMLRNLGDLSEFERSVQAVLGHVEASSARDQAILEALFRAADEIGRPLDRNAFQRREESTDEDGNVVKGQFPHRLPLNEFTGNVKGVVTRCNDYADTLTEAINRVSKHEWEADVRKVRDEREYAGVLTSLQNDFDEINEKLALYEQAKKEVAEQKKRIEELVNDLEMTNTDLRETKRELAKLKTTAVRRLPGGALVGPGEAGGLNPDLAGKVLQVNKEWNFVVIDVGRKDHVPENLRMLVARDDKLVAKLLVSKVLGQVSVAEIMPEALVSDVRVGDRVIMPKAQE